MDEWDAQKMLDLYIYDYLVRKNMNTTAEILAKEADIQTKTVVINPPEGFLSEWWSLFWDVYSSRIPNNPQEQASTSKAPVNDGTVLQDSQPMSLVPDVNYMLQNICPTTPRSGFPNLLQTVNNPTPMPRPDMGSLLQNNLPTMMPKMEFTPPNRFGQSPISMSDNTLRQEQLLADYVAQRAREQEHLTRLPPRSLDANSNALNVDHNNTLRQEQLLAEYVVQRAREQEHLTRLPPRSLDANSNALNVDHLANMLPSGSSSSRRPKKVSSKRQYPALSDMNSGTGLRRSVTSELIPQAPKLIQDDIGQADGDASNMHVPLENLFPVVENRGRNVLGTNSSQGRSSNVIVNNTCHIFNNNIPVSDQQIRYPSQSEGCQEDSSSDLAAQASKKLIISASENITKMTSPHLSNDDSKGKGVQIEMNTEVERPLDEEIASFFSNDEASDDMIHSFTHTSPQKQNDPQDFPFGLLRSMHPSNNKLSCCDFSSQGKFLAAAGHEKKVFVWNLKQLSRTTSVQAHTQLITDIRFKPNSSLFATSSFDRIVKIWDANNARKTLQNLVGHADQVVSVDFHPRKPNLVCSCDCSDEIRLWNAKDSACFRFFKGANRQVRFQPRHGNLMAAATGNVINLIDVETSMIQYRFEGHEKEVRTLCWDVCGEYVVSVSQDSCRIWSIVSGGKCIHALPSTASDFTSCTFHPAYSQVVAVGSYESIYIWNPTMGSRTWKFNAHKGIVSAIANASETNMMASVSHDQCVKMWK